MRTEEAINSILEKGSHSEYAVFPDSLNELMTNSLFAAGFLRALEWVMES